MKREILEFYATHGFHITKLINKRPRPLTRNQVEAAAEQMYLSGELFDRKQINWARAIWDRASYVAYDDYVKDNEILLNTKAAIQKVDDSRHFWKCVSLTAIILSAWLVALLSGVI